MTIIKPVPAVQYVRMSTEHQQYSLDNQSTAIQAYASLHDFEIVRTYSDSAKSGVVLRNRPGLQQLLQDVVGGTTTFKAILVYDISRWGRFQDTDESAHYEFICKSAGVPIHYCAETFANDGTLPSLIMKALKRTMAGEYSRELGVKVLAGQKRLARLGFKQGGRAGYGLQRVLVTPDRVRKQVLELRERKSIATDRVILVPGPPSEVQCVREIFQMLVSGGLTVYAIARKLNRDGIKYMESTWDYQAVHNILTHPKYMGCHVFGRTSAKLYTPMVKLPKSEWVLTPGAFEPIVDVQAFERAQELLQARIINKSNEDILDGLKALLSSKGKLSLRLIENSPALPSPSTFRRRFGGFTQAYALIGYTGLERSTILNSRHRNLVLRGELFQRIVEAGRGDVTVIQRGAKLRKRLRLRDGRTVAVIVAHAFRVWKTTVRWPVNPHPDEKNLITLVARLNEENTEFMDFYVFRRIGSQARFYFSKKDSRLRLGVRLSDLSRLCDAARSVQGVRRGKT
jgi:DNA invertase Pin-like site-specific DNA recombinase